MPSRDLESDCREVESSDGDISQDGLVDAVKSNGQLLEELLDRVSAVQSQLAGDGDSSPESQRQEGCSDEDRQWLEERVDDYRRELDACEQKIADLEKQNEDLASQVASSTVRQTVACSDSGTSDALSWEDRKKLILQQMEEGSYDAEGFADHFESDEADSSDPVRFVEQLQDELERTKEDLARRDDEIGELHCLLEQQSSACSGGVAVGAAAIAGMVDSNEIVQQERERLQQLQEEWEEKFRQSEIEVSLERAKLSRERMELARQNSELEERIEHMQRENRQSEESGNSRRWLAKLGLAED